MKKQISERERDLFDVKQQRMFVVSRRKIPDYDPAQDQQHYDQN